MEKPGNMIFAFLRWLALLPLNIVVDVLAFILAPVLPLFASKDGWLPKWLWWWQTPDNPLDGDAGFLAEHAPYKGTNLPWWKVHINRTFWQWRNPAMGFGMTVMSFTPQEPYIMRRLGGEKTITGDMSEGWYFVVVTNPDGKTAWQFFLVHWWTPTAFAKINIGWKLWSAPNVCQYVFAPTKLWRNLA